MWRREWQPNFPGWEAPRPDALFFALRPAGEARQNVADLSHAVYREHGLRGNLIARERLHVSMLGWEGFRTLPEGVEEFLSEIVRPISLPPFMLGFDRMMSFRHSGSKPLVLLPNKGLAEFDALCRLVWERLLARMLVTQKFKSATPHVTMLYDVREIGEQLIPSIGWMVREVTLVHSVRGRGGFGPVHRDLARWTLTG